MPSDSPTVAALAPDMPATFTPSLTALFAAFAKMSLAGFGGVMVWARRGIVDQKKWMTAEEFNEAFALCLFLPGPNIVNFSIVFGSRFRGIPGAIAAFGGLLGPPVVIVTIVAMFYQHYGAVDALRRVLAGVSCAAVGLLISLTLRMMMPLIKKRDLLGLVILVAVFIAVGVVRLPLYWVLLVAIPVSVAVSFVMRRKAVT